MCSVAAGQNTTFFLARPNEKLSELPRHPMQLEGVPETCVICEEEKGDDDSPLECEKVRDLYSVLEMWACADPAAGFFF